MVRTLVRPALALAASGAIAAGCSGTTSTPTAAPGSSVKPGITAAPANADSDPSAVSKIVSFDVPESVTCPANATSMKLKIPYAAQGTRTVTIYVDGRATPMLPPNGIAEPDVHCDELQHTVVMVAADEQGRPTTMKKIAVTNVSVPAS